MNQNSKQDKLPKNSDTKDTKILKNSNGHTAISEETADKILHQLEFYFSDSNLRTDKFLKTCIYSTQEGYVDIEVLLKFNKMRTLCNGDLKTLVSVAQKSQQLVLSEDHTKIKRKAPIPEKFDNFSTRTIYVDNLPKNSTIESLQAIFNKSGKINIINIPKDKESKQIKGFAFVEYNTLEQAKKAILDFNGVTIADCEQPLYVITKKEWSEMKRQYLENLETPTQNIEQNKTSTQILNEDNSLYEDKKKKGKRKFTNENTHIYFNEEGITAQEPVNNVNNCSNTKTVERIHIKFDEDATTSDVQEPKTKKKKT